MDKGKQLYFTKEDLHKMEGALDDVLQRLTDELNNLTDFSEYDKESCKWSKDDSLIKDKEMEIFNTKFLYLKITCKEWIDDRETYKYYPGTAVEGTDELGNMVTYFE